MQCAERLAPSRRSLTKRCTSATGVVDRSVRSNGRLLCGVLWLREHQREWPSQRDLAEHTGVDAMMTSQVVRALEKSGLIERVVDDRDARVRHLRCTRSGRSLAMRAIKLIEQIDDGFFGVSDERAAQIEALRLMSGRDADGNIIDPRWNRDLTGS
jgi:DNA-binding MarR family transcriptional regulator